MPFVTALHSGKVCREFVSGFAVIDKSFLRRRDCERRLYAEGVDVVRADQAALVFAAVSVMRLLCPVDLFDHKRGDRELCPERDRIYLFAVLRKLIIFVGGSEGNGKRAAARIGEPVGITVAHVCGKIFARERKFDPLFRSGVRQALRLVPHGGGNIEYGGLDLPGERLVGHLLQVFLFKAAGRAFVSVNRHDEILTSNESWKCKIINRKAEADRSGRLPP